MIQVIQVAKIDVASMKLSIFLRKKCNWAEADMSPLCLPSVHWSIKTTSGIKYCIAEMGKVQSGG